MKKGFYLIGYQIKGSISGLSFGSYSGELEKALPPDQFLENVKGLIREANDDLGATVVVLAVSKLS